MKIPYQSIKESVSFIYLYVNIELNRGMSETMPSWLIMQCFVDVCASNSTQSRYGEFSKLKNKFWRAENFKKISANSVKPLLSDRKKFKLGLKSLIFEGKRNKHFFVSKTFEDRQCIYACLRWSTLFEKKCLLTDFADNWWWYIKLKSKIFCSCGYFCRIVT